MVGRCILGPLMFIDIKKVPEGSSSESVQLTLPEELAALGSLNTSVSATQTLRRFGSLIVAELSYHASYAGSCDRCLKEITGDVEGDVSFTLGSKCDEEMASENVDFYLYGDEDEKIDYSQSLYDDIMTRLPQKVLCSDNCTGFKQPTESTSETDASEAKEIDPRWAALGKLKKK